MTTDTFGNPWAKLSTLKPGDLLEADNGFTCIEPGDIKMVMYDDSGYPYITCRCGRHYLNGQVKDDSLIGLYPA